MLKNLKKSQESKLKNKKIGFRMKKNQKRTYIMILKKIIYKYSLLRMFKDN